MGLDALPGNDTPENVEHEDYGVSFDYATALADSDAALERATLGRWRGRRP